MISERGDVCLDTWNASVTKQKKEAKTSASSATVGQWLQGRGRFTMVE